MTKHMRIDSKRNCFSTKSSWFLKKKQATTNCTVVNLLETKTYSLITWRKSNILYTMIELSICLEKNGRNCNRLTVNNIDRYTFKWMYWWLYCTRWTDQLDGHVINRIICLETLESWKTIGDWNPFFYSLFYIQTDKIR